MTRKQWIGRRPFCSREYYPTTLERLEDVRRINKDERRVGMTLPRVRYVSYRRGFDEMLHDVSPARRRGIRCEGVVDGYTYSVIAHRER